MTDPVTLGIAVTGVALSAASLSWQTATYKLTGGRVKIDLRAGAMHVARTGMVLHDVEKLSAGWETHLADQGYVTPIIGVQVRNVGRMAVTVAEWNLTCPQKDMSFRPIGDNIGERLPYRLEAGSAETWMMDLQNARALLTTTAETFGLPIQSLTLVGVVKLADGRAGRSREVHLA